MVITREFGPFIVYHQEIGNGYEIQIMKSDKQPGLRISSDELPHAFALLEYIRELKQQQRRQN